jgi:hypothetical protein
MSAMFFLEPSFPFSGGSSSQVTSSDYRIGPQTWSLAGLRRNNVLYYRGIRMIKAIKAWLKGLVFGMHISTKLSVSSFLSVPMRLFLQ